MTGSVSEGEDGLSQTSDEERMRLIPADGSQHSEERGYHMAGVNGLDLGIPAPGGEPSETLADLDRRFWNRPSQQWSAEGLESAIHSEALGVYAEESGWLSDQEPRGPRGLPAGEEEEDEEEEGVICSRGLPMSSAVPQSEHNPLARRDSECLPLQSSTATMAGRGGSSSQRHRSGSRAQEGEEDSLGMEGDRPRDAMLPSCVPSLSPSHRPEPVESPMGPPSAAAAGAAAALPPPHSAHRHVVDPVVLLSLVAPISALTLIFPSIAFELSAFLSSSVWTDSTQLGVLLAAVAGGGAVAFLLIFAEVQVVSRTSALTTTVIGHAKESVVIVLSILIYGDTLTWLNCFGVMLAFVGTGLYSYTKHRERVEREAAQGSEGTKTVGRRRRRGRTVSQSSNLPPLGRERKMDIEPDRSNVSTDV